MLTDKRIQLSESLERQEKTYNEFRASEDLRYHILRRELVGPEKWHNVN
jgi:hypothetical protein